MDMRETLDLLAGAVARSQKQGQARMEWATAAGERSVVLDTDPERAELPLTATGVGPLVTGWRVLVARDGKRLTAVASPDALQPVGAVQSLAQRLSVLEARTPIVETGITTVSLSNAAYAQHTVGLSRPFTNTAAMSVVGNATNYDTRYVVRTLVNSLDAVTIGVRHVDGVATTGTVPVSWIVAQT